LERAFAQSVLSTQYRLLIDIDSLVKADVGELYSALLKARQGGWISPNDAREECVWPRVADGDNIEPPVAGGKPAGSEDAPPSDDAGAKVARLPDRRTLRGPD
jgi:hypothetical protein